MNLGTDGDSQADIGCGDSGAHWFIVHHFAQTVKTCFPCGRGDRLNDPPENSDVNPQHTAPLLSMGPKAGPIPLLDL